MMRIKFTPFLILLLVLVSGCQVFPYIYDPATPTPAEITDPSPSPTQPTSVPTATLAPIEPTATPEEDPTPTPIPDQYTFQDGSPLTLPNFSNPEDGCAWMGAAGQVFDREGNVVLGLTIRIGGPVENETGQASGVTGQSTAYGAGGYEVQISSTPTNTSDSYWIQVFDPNGNPLSEQLFFDTYEDCERNLILINFIPLEAPDAQGAELTPAVPATLEAYP